MMRSQWWLQKARRKMDPRKYDLLLLNLVHRATDRWLRSGGFHGEARCFSAKASKASSRLRKANVIASSLAL